MLTDIQITDLAQRMNIPYAGCFFKDELPHIEPNKVYIINLQDGVDDDGNQNSGTHWTMLYVRKTPKDNIQPIFFDPYGAPPSEAIKSAVKKDYKHHLPHTTKDIQSLMNNACGFFCLAIAHFITAYRGRTNDLYTDVDNFIDMFDDLNHSIDWKKNEFTLKFFFESEDPSLRKPIDVLPTSHDFYDKILDEDEKGGKNLMRLPVDVKTNTR
jgi:hypothetical protein